jgi:hypothetical protein
VSLAVGAAGVAQGLGPPVLAAQACRSVRICRHLKSAAVPQIWGARAVETREEAWVRDVRWLLLRLACRLSSELEGGAGQLPSSWRRRRCQIACAELPQAAEVEEPSALTLFH